MSARLNIVCICNAVCLSANSSTVQVVLARIRGDVPTLPSGDPNPHFDGRTVKLAPHLFHGNFPFPGEAIAIEATEDQLRDAGPSYRALRSCLSLKLIDNASKPASEDASQGPNATQSIPEAAPTPTEAVMAPQAPLEQIAAE